MKQGNDNEKKLEILLETIDAASSTFDLSQILSNIVKIIERFSHSNSCFIYLITGDELVLKASHKPLHREIKMKIGEGITGWVAETKKTVVIKKKAYEDKRFKLFNNLTEDTYEAFLSVPIIFRKKVIGVINLQYKRPHRHTRRNIELLEAVGKQVGGILEVSRLITETNILKDALEIQKLANRAKAILMRNTQVSEDEAHKILIKKSMDKRKSLKEVCEAIILADEMALH